MKGVLKVCMDATLQKRAGGGMRTWVFGLVLLGLLLAAFPQVMLGLHSFVYRDYGVLGYPFVHFHHESFWRGEFPLWNPYSNCGAPFMAQWGTMTLYPGSLIYLLLPLPWSLGFFCLAHLALGGAGMFALARRWVGGGFPAGVAGMAWVFCGTTFSCLMWPNYAVALGWMPWVVLLAERSWREGGRWLVAAAVAATLQLMSGVPEIVLLTWLFSGCLCATEFWRSPDARWRMARRFGVVVLVVAGLAAAQLLPFLELLDQSQRDRSFATSKWPMPGWGLANLLVPLFHCRETMQGPFMQPGQAFMGSYYPGAGVLVLAFCTLRFARERRVWVLAGLVVFSFLMAWGENGFLYPLVKRFIPLLGVARYPIKFVLLAAFALPLLAAFAVRALDRVGEGLPSRQRFLALAGGGAVLVMAGLVWLAWSHPWRSAELPAGENALLGQWEWRHVAPNAAGRAGLLIVTLGALVAMPRLRTLRWRMVAQGAVLAAIFVDAMTHVPVQNPTVPVAVFDRGLWQAENRIEPPRLGEGRVLISPGAEERLLYSTATNLTLDFLGKRLALWSNLNLLEDVPKVNGSSTLQLREQMQVQSLIYSGSNKFDHGLIEMLGVTLYSPPGNPTEWRPVTNACPFVSCGQTPVFADAAGTLRDLAGPGFNPHEQVFLRPEDRLRVSATNRAEAKILGTTVSAHAVEAEVEASAATLVVISQSFCPGWRATIDGNEVALLRANHAFQALEVPAGRHRVRLAYRDHRFLLGGVISMVTLAGCGWFWFRHRARAGVDEAPVREEAFKPAKAA